MSKEAESGGTPAPGRVQGPVAVRQRETRHRIDTAATLRLVNIAANIEGRITDISFGGCRIQTQRPIKVGIFCRVEIEFRVEGLPVRLAGVTQAIYDEFNVGIRFLEVSGRKREQLAQIIEEIRAQRTSPG